MFSKAIEGFKKLGYDIELKLVNQVYIITVKNYDNQVYIMPVEMITRERQPEILESLVKFFSKLKR